MEQYNLKSITREKYQAVMVLAAVGDAMGYYNGKWEFNTSSKIIHSEMMKITNNKGPSHLRIDLAWKYSDDTVMHIATAEALSQIKPNDHYQSICKNIAKQYKACWARMSGRAPGKTTGRSIKILQKDGSNWNKIPFADRACGCGGSMRSACIGLIFFKDIQKLVIISIQAGRLTHHNPIGYLGSFVSSYFTSLALKNIPIQEWVAYLFQQGLPLARKHILQSKRQIKLNLQSNFWQRFENEWIKYSKERNISLKLNQNLEPTFPQKYDIIERERFYRKFSWNGWPGSLGIDSIIIAYDALLGSKDNWQQLCLRAMLHGGDNDSTGTIAGAWFGAVYGFKNVPKQNINFVQDKKKLFNLGNILYEKIIFNKQL